jgi:hypothetical protein
MNQSIRTVINPVTGLARAKAMFRKFLGVEPYVDSPYYESLIRKSISCHFAPFSFDV